MAHRPCCNKTYHRFFEIYRKEEIHIWELGCLECPPHQCVCSIGKITGSKVQNCVEIYGDFHRVVILNLDNDTYSRLVTGGHEFTRNFTTMKKGITVYCTCSIRALARINFLSDKNVYLSAAEGHKVTPAGACNNTGTVFIIHSKSGHLPSLYVLSQLALLKEHHSLTRLKGLVNSGHMPAKLLADFPEIHYAASGFTHMALKGKHTVRFSTCCEAKHTIDLKLNEKETLRDSIIF